MENVLLGHLVVHQGCILLQEEKRSSENVVFLHKKKRNTWRQNDQNKKNDVKIKKLTQAAASYIHI